MTEGRLNRRAPRRRTRVDARRMIEAIRSGAVAQSTVRFDVRDPGSFRNEAACRANPVLYFAVGRHFQSSRILTPAGQVMKEQLHVPRSSIKVSM
jgi:hypothetical protein